jgi:hypothetical protein
MVWVIFQEYSTKLWVTFPFRDFGVALGEPPLAAARGEGVCKSRGGSFEMR